MAYVCTACGLEYPKWQGKCDGCDAWNQLIQHVSLPKSKHNQLPTAACTQPGHISQPKTLEEIASGVDARLLTGDDELNRVLGGGIVPGSLILLGGEPGIGKSTLLLQMALKQNSHKTLYVSGEETEYQIKLRAERLGYNASNCFLLQEHSLTQILEHVDRLTPVILIIDSIQTLYCLEEEGSIGSMNQIRACTARLLHYAKNRGVSIFLTGHINKEGALAGPKLLEHMVDTVLQFEGDKQFLYRLVRTIKNRFGPTAELGIYAMQNSGLHAITNPSAMLLSPKDYALSGISIATCLEGTRPLMLEIQALITNTRHGTPQRNATGYDIKRLVMLLAVLEKRTGLRVVDRDVFLNITGGIRSDDTALDLAICMAIASALQDRSIPYSTCFMAEVGLGGELRNVQRVSERIAEAAKLGFKEVFIAVQHQPLPHTYKITIHMVGTLKEVLQLLT